MTTESAIFLIAIVLAFLIFGGVLAWVDHYARDVRRGGRPAE